MAAESTTSVAVTTAMGVTLVKNGIWQVPPGQRPPNWQTMAVKESTEKTITKTNKTTREVLIQATQEPETSKKDALTQAPQPELRPEPPLISYLAADDQRGVTEATDLLVSLDEHGLDEDYELAMDRLWEMSTELLRWRKAKAKVDRALSHWVNRHKKQLRHVELGSACVRDLWSVFHMGIMLEMEEADRRLQEQRDKDHLAKSASTA